MSKAERLLRELRRGGSRNRRFAKPKAPPVAPEARVADCFDADGLGLLAWSRHTMWHPTRGCAHLCASPRLNRTVCGVVIPPHAMWEYDIVTRGEALDRVSCYRCVRYMQPIRDAITPET